MSVLPVSNNLRNPGAPVDNVYQTGNNLKVSKTRVLSHDCFEKDFDTSQFGGSSITLVVPSNALISDVMVYLKWKGNASPGYYLPPSWGYKAIRDITYIFGGSQQIKITGEANFLRAMNEAENDRKKTAIIENGGSLLAKAVNSTETAAVSADAAVHIYAPCSSVNAMKQIPFDADLLNGNITIRIALKSAEEVWGIMKSAARPGPTVGINADMRKLDTARWYLRQFSMIDTAASKKDEVGPNGQYMQPYFWYHSHTFSGGEGAINEGTVALNKVGEVGITKVQSVTLNGFTNGSLQALTLYVQRTDESYLGQAAADGIVHQPSFMDCIKLSDIELKYNGRCIYKSEFDKVAKLLDLSVHHTDSTYNQPRVKEAGTTPAFTVEADTANRANIYRIQLSQFSEVFRDYLQTGAELSANTMQLTFKINDNDLSVTRTEDARYTCNVEYIYQASVTVQRGVGRFDFQNPLPDPVPSVPRLAP